MSSVVIAEGEAISRHGLRQMLEAAGHEIVGEADNGLQAAHLALSRTPDLLVLALKLDRLSGIEVIKRLRAQALETKILVVSSQDDDHTIGLCMNAGANGFVSKVDDLSELHRALDAFDHQRTYFPDMRSTGDSTRCSEEEQIAQLTDRERTVLSYLARGYRLTKIAQVLVVGESTVSTYKSRLMRKLNAPTIVELTDIARRNHLVDMPAVQGELHTLPDWLAAETSVVRNLLDTIPSSLSLRDPQGNMIFANAYLRAQLGADLEQVSRTVPEAFERVLGLSAQQAQEMLHSFAESAASGTTFRHEYSLNVRGTPRSAAVWAAPMQDENGALIALVCGSHDITTIDLAIKELRQSREELGRIAKLKGMLLGNVERDLQDAVHLANDELLKASNAGTLKEVAELLGGVKLALDTLQQRIANVHVLLQDAADSPHPLRERCNLHAMFHQGMRPIVEAGRRDERKVTLQYSGSPDLQVWAEATKFQHIIFSLADIAYRCAAEGPLVASMTATPKTRGLIEARLNLSTDVNSDALTMFQAELSRLRDIAEAGEGHLQYQSTPIRIEAC